MNFKQKIADIQEKMGKLKKDTSAFKYKYATLDQIQDKLRPLLDEHGLLLTHPLGRDGEVNYLTTVIEEIDGDEKLESIIVLPQGVSPQDSGSAITYFRRYNLLSMLDLETEDDDAKKATDNFKKGL